MAINIQHEPNRLGTSLLTFMASLGLAQNQKKREQREIDAQIHKEAVESARHLATAGMGIGQANMARTANAANRMNLQQMIGQQGMEREGFRQESAAWRQKVGDFQDQYGVTPSALVGQVPHTGPGILQQPPQQADPMGGMAGPPASMAPGMQPIPLTPEAQQQQQGGAPLSQSQPPEEAGPQFYSQGNMAVVPSMVKLKKKLDKYTTAADAIVSTPSRIMPDEEKAAQLSVLSPWIATMKREYDALTKRYPAPKPITDYAGLQNAGFAIDMPGNDAVWYKTKDGYKPMTVHPKDSQGWMSEQDPEVREAKKVQHFQDNYHQNEDGTEFLFDGKKWNRQKAEKEADYGKEFDKKVALELDYILEEHAGDDKPYSLTRDDRIRARAAASEYIDFKNQALGRDSQTGGQERRVYTPAENEVFAIERMSKARGGRVLAAERQRLIELQQIIQMEQSEFPQMPGGAGQN